MPKRIAIDIDSTLHHYWDQLREVVLRLHGVDLPYEHQTTWEIPQLEREALAAAVRETHSPPFVLAAEPYPGAAETLRAWHEAGHFIHITSHRSADAHDATVRWLQAAGIAHDELYCSYDKVTRCVEIGIDVLIDDSPVNLQQAAGRGIVAATLEHPWNADLCARDGVVSAPDWDGLRSALEPILDG